MQDKLRQGEALFAEGKIEEAEKCFLELLNKNSEDAEVLNNMGVISHAKGSFEKSESYLLKAISVKEDYLDALFNLSDLYQSTERWEEAAIQLEQYLKIDNQDHNVFNQLALFYLEAGNTQNARSALEHSLKLIPDQDIVIESLKQLQSKKEISYYLPRPGSFRAAFVEINITPNVSEQNPVFLQGMGGAPRKATAISEPLMMQLLLLEDDHFTKILFVTADLFGFGPEIVDNVRTLVAQWGIEPEGLVLNASHTHYAPGTISHASKSIGPFYSEYSIQIVQAIGQQLPMLYDKLEECEFFWGKVEAQIGVSRRLKKEGKVIFAPNPEGDYDKDTPFLLLHMLKTDKKALLVNHGCHPTGLGSENFISADYPGYMRDALKSNGVVDGVMFLQGGAGSTKETISTNGNIRFCVNSKGSRENGQILSKRIIDGFKKGLQPVNGSLFCTRRIIRLSLKQPPPPRVLAQIRDNTGTDDLIREWASNLLNRFPNGDFPDELNLEVQLVSLGDKVTIVTLPGEPVAELASKLRRLTGNPNSTFVLGYTNGLIGYLPTDRMIEEGGYETDVSKFAYLLPSALNRGTESAIISGVENCIGAKVDTENPTGYGRCHLVKKDQKAFFVLSAGRCGTMTLSHLLNTATNARVWHHPQPDPIKESLSAYRGEIDKRKAFWKARYPIIHKTWSEGLIHGETDLLMTPFCDTIAEEIPDSKFIVLVRDIRDFVISGMRRNYYCGHPWDLGRLRPMEGTKEFKKWNKLDQFGKICWLWTQTYTHIQQTVEGICDSRVLLVRFEDLVSSWDKTQKIFNFLELEGYDEERTRLILSKKLNSQTTGFFPKPKDWAQHQHDTLWQICGTIAESFGYFRDYTYKAPMKTGGLQDATVRCPHKRQGPRVSVGLAVYNGGTLLAQAIDSILSQDFADIEIIISDNGSTDETPEVCSAYAKADSRVQFSRLGENLGALRNFLRVLELSSAPYFMWASHDDLREESFITRCLSILEKDSTIALVYPRAKVVDKNSKVIGMGDDRIHADQKKPIDRYRHLIWNLNMCNLFYGLYRTPIVSKARSLHKNLYRGYDNLFLAEIALLGKIIRIDDILFIRRLTRNYNLTLQERNADLITCIDPKKEYEGITFPFCRLTYSHLELINETDLRPEEKCALLDETLNCFRSRFGPQMQFEIQRAIDLVRQGKYYVTWEGRRTGDCADIPTVWTDFHLNNLVKGIREALFIYPEMEQLKWVYHECLEQMKREHPITSCGESTVNPKTECPKVLAT
jgi:glycosyltransferase involved in cell wall biosynthesis